MSSMMLFIMSGPVSGLWRTKERIAPMSLLLVRQLSIRTNAAAHRDSLGLSPFFGHHFHCQNYYPSGSTGCTHRNIWRLYRLRAAKYLLWRAEITFLSLLSSPLSLKIFLCYFYSVQLQSLPWLLSLLSVTILTGSATHNTDNSSHNSIYNFFGLY